MNTLTHINLILETYRALALYEPLSISTMHFQACGILLLKTSHSLSLSPP